MIQGQLFEIGPATVAPCLSLGSRVYIAGPMTGQQDRNFPLFFSVERSLRAQGYRPINPARNDGPSVSTAVQNANQSGLSWADYMRMDLRRLSRSDAICLLPGWYNSKGAGLERTIAEALGMPVYVWHVGRARMEPADG